MALQYFGPKYWPFRLRSKSFAYNLNATIIRHLTQAQVSTALRPFYFLVHPDLFAKYPKEQSVNETSLKSLKMYLSVMIEDRKVVQAPTYATFYLKPRTQCERQNRTKLKSVRLQLKQERKVRSAVIKILKGCDLPTSYVDSIPERKDEAFLDSRPAVWEDLDAAAEAHEIELAKRRKKHAVHSTDVSQPLKIWLTNNVENARAKMAKSESTRLELERRQDELCNAMSMADISWDSDSGWETIHRIGTVNSLTDLCEHHYSTVKDILKGRTIVIGGTGSGLSLDGEIIIYSGEVRYNWLHTIRCVPEAEKLLRKIPLVERALSQLLRNIQIVRTKHQKSVTVENYRLRLRQLITNMGDYLGARSFPLSWPSSLSQLQMCVVTESCPLMVTPEGQILVPASCPGFLLVEFLSNNMKGKIIVHQVCLES